MPRVARPCPTNERQYAVKEVAKYMATPTQGNWLLLKRLARYLIGAPRLVHTFEWHNKEAHLSAYTDSDWAGDKISRKSTSGCIVFARTRNKVMVE